MLPCKGGSEEKVLWRCRQQSTSYAETILRKLGRLIIKMIMQPYFNLTSGDAPVHGHVPHRPLDGGPLLYRLQWWSFWYLSGEFGSSHLQQTIWTYFVHPICNRLFEHFPLQNPPYRSKDWVPLGLGWIQMTDVACCEICLSIVEFW